MYRICIYMYVHTKYALLIVGSSFKFLSSNPAIRFIIQGQAALSLCILSTEYLFLSISYQRGHVV